MSRSLISFVWKPRTTQTSPCGLCSSDPFCRCYTWRRPAPPVLISPLNDFVCFLSFAARMTGHAVTPPGRLARRPASLVLSGTHSGKRAGRQGGVYTALLNFGTRRVPLGCASLAVVTLEEAVFNRPEWSCRLEQRKARAQFACVRACVRKRDSQGLQGTAPPIRFLFVLFSFLSGQTENASAFRNGCV